jgi:Toastrack DUF4097
MKVFETPGDVTLRVAMGGGEITVAACDEPRVSVDAFALREDEATREALEELRIEHSERAGRHDVTVEVPKRRGLLGLVRSPSIGLRIRCPQGAELELTTSSADLDATGQLGAVTAKSASGDLRAATVCGRCELVTASGDAVLGDVAGPTHVKTASGDVEVASSDGPFEANLVSGDLVVRRSRGDVAVNSVSGDIDVEAASASVKVTTVSGDVRLGVVDGLKLWIDASSVSGTMRSELEMSDARPDAEGDLVEIRARTVSGDLTISRARAGVASS